MSYYNHYPYRRVRFRSNGSFVIYENDSTIMEGNWEPVPQGLRIFGRKYFTNPRASEYLQAMKLGTEVKIFQAVVEAYDPAKIGFEQAKKYLKTIMADREFYKPASKNQCNFWWLAMAPDGAKLTGAGEADFMRKAYDLAVKEKAILLYSPLFTDFFLPGDGLYQTYGMSI